MSSNEVCMGCQDEMAAVDPRSLEVRWRSAVDGLWPSEYWPGGLLLLCGDVDYGFYSLPEKRIRWTWRLHSSIERWGRYVLGVTEEGLEYRDPESGSQLDVVRVREGRGQPWIVGAVGNSSLLLRYDDSVVSFDPERRTLLWERDLRGELARRLGIGGEVNLVLDRGSDEKRFLGAVLGTGYVLACSVEDGSIEWIADVEGSSGGAAASKGRVRVLTPQRFLVLRESSGEVLAEGKDPTLREILYPGVPVAWNGKAVYATLSGHVAVFAEESAELLCLQRHATAFATPGVLGERMFVPAADGSLWVFEWDS